MTLALFAIASFLIGSIPFGYVIGVLFFKTDIRKAGSGNIGAMNAMRTIGKGGAVAVLLLDALKGFFPPHAAAHIDLLPSGVAIVAACAVLGHCFSPWMGWKGGKGVATSFGAIFALCWPAGLHARKRAGRGGPLVFYAQPVAYGVWGFCGRLHCIYASRKYRPAACRTRKPHQVVGLGKPRCVRHRHDLFKRLAQRHYDRY